ncbi:MAG TPA: hypothetical protein VNR60_07580 [Croceibacterium sp.]|nr:hypothetical protein [Croceibacterium sp.]
MAKAPILACCAMLPLAAVPATALGQHCAQPLQEAGEKVSHLPGETPYQVSDQLQLYYDQASDLLDADPEQCLAIVARMNALIARYMPGGAGSGGVATDPTPVSPHGQPVLSVDDVLAETRQSESERMERRMAHAAHDAGDDLRKVGDYRDAARGYAAAMQAFGASGNGGLTELAEIGAAVEAIETATREMEDIVVINAPDDVMHARLEDAVRRVEAARRALERAWQRYHARQAADDGFLAPLVPQDDFIAPLGDADTRAAQARLRSAERALKQVRNAWDPYIHRTDRPFLDMRDGYKQAFRGEYDGFAEELGAFDATADSYMPDRIGEFTRRRAQLWDRHEQRLEAIFDRYAIP